MKSGMKTALVLQGGGALGAYELGVIKRLCKEPGFMPSIIAGVSLGAINAAAMAGARHDPVGVLEEMWSEFEVAPSPMMAGATEQMISLWGNRSFYNMRYDYYRFPTWTCFYDMEPLRRMMMQHIDFDFLNSMQAPDLILTATDVRTGQVCTFRNKQKGYRITPDHVMASCSLPPGFPMTPLKNEMFWDGGMFCNTPLAPVIEAMMEEPSMRRRIFIVNLFPQMGKIPENMLEVFDRIYEITFSNKMIEDVETMKKVNKFVGAMDAIDAALGQLPKGTRDKIRGMEGYKCLRAYERIQDIVMIQNMDFEVVSAPFDFSRKTIERRIAAGYRDADMKLKDLAPMMPGLMKIGNGKMMGGKIMAKPMAGGKMKMSNGKTMAKPMTGGKMKMRNGKMMGKRVPTRK